MDFTVPGLSVTVSKQSRGCGQMHTRQQGLLGQDKHPNSEAALCLPEVRCAMASSANKLAVCALGIQIMTELPEHNEGKTNAA